MENPKSQLIERLKTANNVLVTVSTNPSVDQLAAALGLTLMLNKLGKHGTAVFSGEVPSTIEFLQPEKTLEKNTDSLRDFIIALDKSKADKLRYKVEDNFVRIFITPYKTSISEKDLDFSQGDFNVEVVVALGVHDQKDLDRAITAHGRILHDATTFALTTDTASNLGSVNWSDQTASSLCEMVAGLAGAFQPDLLDGQMSTALLTGIIAETKRFSNQKTTAVTMNLSASLMSAGANQQLVASKLEEPKEIPEEPKKPAKQGHKAAKKHEEEESEEPPKDDGSLQINHEAPKPIEEIPAAPEEPEEEIPEPPQEDLVIDNEGKIQAPGESADELPILSDLPSTQIPEDEPETPAAGTSRITERPSYDSNLTANTEPEQLDPAIDPLGAGQHATPLLSHEETPADTEQPAPPSPDEYLASGPQTLTDLEQAVSSPHVDTTPSVQPDEPVIPEAPEPDLGGARDAVGDALASMGPAPEPIAGLNAQALGDNLHEPAADTPFTMPDNLVPAESPVVDTTAAPADTPAAPPTVPPPFMPDIPGLDGGVSSPSEPDLSVQPGLLPDDDRPAPPAQGQQNNPFNLPPA